MCYDSKGAEREQKKLEEPTAGPCFLLGVQETQPRRIDRAVEPKRNVNIPYRREQRHVRHNRVIPAYMEVRGRLWKRKTGISSSI